MGEIFSHTGDSPKWVKSKRRRKREKERLNDGNNNGQATHGARKHAWRTQATWAKILVEKNLFISIILDQLTKLLLTEWFASQFPFQFERASGTSLRNARHSVIKIGGLLCFSLH